MRFIFQNFKKKSELSNFYFRIREMWPVKLKCFLLPAMLHVTLLTSMQKLEMGMFYKYFYLFSYFCHAKPAPRAAGGRNTPPPPPCTFPSIAQKRKGIELRNFRNPFLHQFYTCWPKENFAPMIGRPWVTSEWCHVLPFMVKNKGLRESLSHDKF